MHEKDVRDPHSIYTSNGGVFMKTESPQLTGLNLGDIRSQNANYVTCGSAEFFIPIIRCGEPIEKLEKNFEKCAFTCRQKD